MIVNILHRFRWSNTQDSRWISITKLNLHVLIDFFWQLQKELKYFSLIILNYSQTLKIEEILKIFSNLALKDKNLI